MVRFEIDICLFLQMSLRSFFFLSPHEQVEDDKKVSEQTQQKYQVDLQETVNMFYKGKSVSGLRVAEGMGAGNETANACLRVSLQKNKIER